MVGTNAVPFKTLQELGFEFGTRLGQGKKLENSITGACVARLNAVFLCACVRERLDYLTHGLTRSI